MTLVCGAVNMVAEIFYFFLSQGFTVARLCYRHPSTMIFMLCSPAQFPRPGHAQLRICSALGTARAVPLAKSSVLWAFWVPNSIFFYVGHDEEKREDRCLTEPEWFKRGASGPGGVVEGRRPGADSRTPHPHFWHRVFTSSLLYIVWKRKPQTPNGVAHTKSPWH